MFEGPEGFPVIDREMTDSELILTIGCFLAFFMGAIIF